jgi:HSP20 family protein
MAEEKQDRTAQQAQGQVGQTGQGEQTQGQQTQGHISRGTHRRGGGGRSGGSARSRLFSPSLFTVSPLTLLATAPFALMRQFAEEMEQLSGESGATTGGVPAQQQQQGASGGGGGTNLSTAVFTPQVDVVERDGQLVIRADLPGMDKNDVAVAITDDAVIIEGERRYEHEENEGGVYRVERAYGTFRRTVPLPEGVDAERATATFRDGVLEIAIPAPQATSRSRRLEIKDGAEGGRQSQTQASAAGTGS